MQLEQLFQIQEVLDQKILDNHHLHQQNLIAEKVLALQTEMAELANETRCFKYWSLKAPSAREVILEEYVDVIHFVLSIGLALGYQDKLQVSSFMGEKEEQELVPLFLLNVERTTTFYKEQSLEQYQQLFEAVLQLGEALGFTQQEIERAYLDKNKQNHQRQAEGY